MQITLAMGVIIGVQCYVGYNIFIKQIIIESFAKTERHKGMCVGCIFYNAQPTRFRLHTLHSIVPLFALNNMNVLLINRS